MDYTIFTFAIGLLIPIAMLVMFPTKITIKEFALHIVLVCGFMFLGWIAGRHISVADTKYINGEVTGKSRDHGSYIRTYSCNCRTVNKTTTCSTCSETRYTVHWRLHSTVGSLLLDSEDSAFRSVYRKSDPSIYTECRIGDPVTTGQLFANYVRAVDQSLFATMFSKDQHAEQSKQAPKPPKLYSVYKYDRVVSSVDQDWSTLNSQLNYYARKYGKHGANPIIVMTDQTDRAYRNTVEKAWKGGKINDVVMIVSLASDNKINWIDGFTYGNSYANQPVLVELRNYLTDIGDLNSVEKQKEFAATVDRVITEKYETTTSKDFEYLKNEIKPSTWVQAVLMVLGLMTSGVLSWFFHKHDIFA